MFPANVWDTPVVLVGLLAVVAAGVIARQSAFYKELVSKEIASQRFHAIDGLRGYLALGVLLHHTTFNYGLYRDGIWGSQVSNLAAFIGPGSVSFFFMITAFLFWNRVIDKEGRMDAYKFYISRLRRLLPMYLVAATLLILTALTLTGFSLQVAPADLIKQILAWLLFTFPGTPDINGLSQTYLINTVFWSLLWEWKFYIALPLAAACAYTRYRWVFFVILLLHLFLGPKVGFVWFFLAGCMAAVLTRQEFVQKLATTRIASLIAISCLIAAVAYVPNRLPYYELRTALLLFVPFIIFAGGNTLFGLLCFRPARLLGLLSYSVYVLHNWVLFVLSRLADQYFSIGALSKEWYWLFGGLMTLTTIAFATITYRFVEYPYIQSSQPTISEHTPPRLRQLYRKLLWSWVQRKS